MRISRVRIVATSRFDPLKPMIYGKTMKISRICLFVAWVIALVCTGRPARAIAIGGRVQCNDSGVKIRSTAVYDTTNANVIGSSVSSPASHE